MELSGGGTGSVRSSGCWLDDVIESRCRPGCKSSGSRLGATWSTGESHVPLGSGKPACQPKVPLVALALSNDTKHEPAWQLLGHRWRDCSGVSNLNEYRPRCTGICLGPKKMLVAI